MSLATAFTWMECQCYPVNRRQNSLSNKIFKSVDNKLTFAISPISYDTKSEYVLMDYMIDHMYNNLKYTLKQIISLFTGSTQFR